MNTTLSFVVPSLQSKEFFVKYLQQNYPELTIIGIEKDSNAFNGAGIQYAPIGSIIELNHENKYDVDWYQNEIWAMINNVNTTLNLETDWQEIKKSIDNYAKKYKMFRAYNNFLWTTPEEPTKKQFTLNNGTKVIIMDAFVKIGNEIIPRYVDESYNFPKSVLQQAGSQVSELKALIIK